ncbi:MAG: hydantoinase/oxoprolinase family protein [Gammaproteobacteria bacterium]
MPERRGRLATDVGGTFTDLVYLDESTGDIETAKVLTTPADPADGVMDVIWQAPVDPGSIAFFIHGGTTVINAITERKGARTALLTTAGFRDVLEIGRGNRPDLYNLQFRSPESFVPRHLRFEVRERLDAGGQIIQALDLDDVDAAARACQEWNVEAVAIAFLHAYREPVHERAAAERLRASLPAVAVTASHEVTREWREYERTNTAVLNAYVQPVMSGYLSRLEVRARQAGIECELNAMQSNVGSTSFNQAKTHPITLVESGPAGGVSGAAYLGRRCGAPDIIYLDVGGTTAKCSLIQGGVARLDSEYRLGRTRLWPGYPVKVPVVDIVEVGAGGGSIARLDDTGLIRVGPQSAGADPGPACYGRGGELPTVTDAKLITGVLDPRTFGGGLFELDPDRAREAMDRIAGPLGRGIEETAFAVIRIAEADMVNALKLITVQRGHDSRDFTLLACGGGGPMHAGALAREVGVKEILVPRYAGIFSAWGMLATPPRRDLARTTLARLDELSRADIRGVFESMAKEVEAYFGAESRSGKALTLATKLAMRYQGQEHSVVTDVDLASQHTEDILDAFHAAHERAFTFRLTGSPVELVTYLLSGELEAPLPPIAPPDCTATTIDTATSRQRQVWFDESGPRSATVHERDRLAPGSTLHGPAVIEENTTTTLVLPGQALRVDEWGALRIRERHGNDAFNK